MFPGSFYSSGCCKEHLSNDSWFRSFSICVISKDFLFFVSSHYLETQWHLSSFVWHIFLFGTLTKIGQADHRYENEESLNCSFLLNFSDVLIESKIFCDVICEGGNYKQSWALFTLSWKLFERKRIITRASREKMK